MDSAANFQSTYLALVALAWQSLERIEQRLDDHPGGVVSQDLQPTLQWLRLELVQLADKSHRLVEFQLVSSQQNTVVQNLTARLLATLDLGTATTEVARMRILHAQNWLFSEAEKWAQVESQDCNLHRA
jgi:hypothetical protein